MQWIYFILAMTFYVIVGFIALVIIINVLRWALTSMIADIIVEVQWHMAKIRAAKIRNAVDRAVKERK
jgi:hypothetical protein